MKVFGVDLKIKTNNAKNDVTSTVRLALATPRFTKFDFGDAKQTRKSKRMEVKDSTYREAL